ncbi:hypothetical protein [Bradyrhizobium sp. ORS 111]|uniref:hypothetical protein n=1 Tax=Bradyrhizobium sp. ORS 111 TaxID=1685958 RepID=UPI00388D71E0
MTNDTLPVSGGAMPSCILTINHLIVEETGDVNIAVLKGLAHRRAMADYGAITPRSLRSAIREYAGMIPQLQTAWRERHGLPVDYVMVTAFGPARDGVRRSAF